MYSKTLLLTTIFYCVLMMTAHLQPISHVIADSSLEAIAFGRDVWSISCNLARGDNVSLTFSPGRNWTQGYFDVPDDYCPVAHLHVFLDITPVDPQGNATEFNIVLVLYNGTLYENSIRVDERGSVVPFSPDNESFLTKAGGTIPFDGIYMVEVVAVEPSLLFSTPPSFLGIYHYLTAQTPLPRVQSQLEPTLKISCETYGNVLLMNSAVSCKALNETDLEVSFQTDFESKGANPLIQFLAVWEAALGHEFGSFEAYNASVDIWGYVMSWETPSMVNWTSSVIHESCPYSYFSVGASWDGQMRSTLVGYEINLSDAIGRAQLTFAETYQLPIMTPDLLVAGHLTLGMKIHGGITKQDDTYFLDLSYGGRSNASSVTLTLLIPENANIIFNSNNLNRLRPNALFGTTSLVPFSDSDVRSYVQYEVLPWYQKYLWNAIILPVILTLFGALLGLIIPPLLRRYKSWRTATRNTENETQLT